MKTEKDMNLEEAAKKKRAEYYREWRAKNKDKTKEYNQRYWEKKVLGVLNER